MDPAMLRFGGADECLRGHAADVHAGPAQYPTFRDRDAGAKVRGFNGSGEPRGAAPHDQEIELAAGSLDFDDQLSRLSHWLAPGAFVVPVRIVAPKPVSFVRCAAICAGFTCRGS